jgi:hypothetical protein
MPPKGVRFGSVDAFNAELGGRDGMPSNLVRYGKPVFQGEAIKYSG